MSILLPLRLVLSDLLLRDDGIVRSGGEHLDTFLAELSIMDSVEKVPLLASLQDFFGELCFDF